MIAQFALRLIVGMSLMWALMPRREVTSGFFRIQMLVTLGLGVLAALTSGQFTGVLSAKEATSFPTVACWLSVAVTVVSFVGSVLWTLERRQGGTGCAFLVLGLSLSALLLSVPQPASAGMGVSVLTAVSEVSTAALVGGLVAAMLLGHWYLTSPTMSIMPLSRLNGFVGGFVAGRAVLSGLGLWMAYTLIQSTSKGAPGAQFLLDSYTHWLWLALRWGAGILGPAAVVVMVHRILKYRNTQSATGVLFVGVIVSFIGELSATLLSRELGVPL